MRKICSDGHNTHDANRRTMAGGGFDFAAHFYTNSPDTTNRFIVFITFFLSFALLSRLWLVLRVPIPIDRSYLPTDRALARQGCARQ